MREIRIDVNNANQRMSKVLSKYLDQASDGFLFKMLRKKNITLNGKKASGKEMLVEGDMIQIFLAEETILKFQKTRHVSDAGSYLDVLYEDEAVLLLNKPVGILSQKAEAKDVSMVELLIDYLYAKGDIDDESLSLFRPSVVNRLDRNTSGLLCAAKTYQAAKQLSDLFVTRNLEKYYLCIVAGKTAGVQHVQAYLSKDEQSNQVKVKEQAFAGANKIETAYQCLASNESFSLLRIHLITGKTHQIRAHLAYLGLPIIGDPKYGDVKVNQRLRTAHGLKHQLLHAYELHFPTLGDSLSNVSGRVFYAPPPKKFLTLCKQLSLPFDPQE